MKKLLVLTAATLPVFWLASCASGTVGNASKSSSSTAAMNSRTADAASTEQNKGFRVKTGDMGDDDYGKIAAKYGTMRKTFNQEDGANKVAPGFDKTDKNFAGKNFDTKPFQKKSFWGDKEYAKKVYGGNTDGSRFMKESVWGSKSASEGNKSARDSNKVFATNDFNGTSKAAQETTKKAFATRSDALTDKRREVGNAFSDPQVLDWREQRALSVQETKKMLGR